MSDREDKNRRFHEFVMDQTRKQPWVSPALEGEWLQKATFHLNMEPFEARALILGATASCNGFVQTEIQRMIDEGVTLFADRKGRIPKDAFRRLAGMVKAMGRGALDQENAEQLVKESVIRRGVTPQGSGLLRSKRWFRKAGLMEAKTV